MNKGGYIMANNMKPINKGNINALHLGKGGTKNVQNIHAPIQNVVDKNYGCKPIKK